MLRLVESLRGAVVRSMEEFTLNVRMRYRSAIVVVCALVLAMLGSGCAKNEEATRLAQQINAARRANGLNPVLFDDRLVEKAQAWAEEMARSGSVRHSLLRQGVGSGWARLAENVGVARSVEEAHQLTMGSPSHRAAVLDRGYTRVGTGVAVVGDKYYFVEVLGV